jgi:hypothetical protein
MLRHVVWIGALVVASGTFGCKKSSDESGGGSGPVDEATFRSSIAADRCARVKDCCGQAKESFDEALCEKQVGATLPGGTGAGGAAGAGGSSGASAVAYDGTQAGKCLDELKSKAQTCSSLFPSGAADAPTGGPIRMSDACSRVFHGSKKVGEACASSLECAPNDKGFAYCNPALAPSSGSGMGACEEVVAGVGQCGEAGGGSSPNKIFLVCVPEGDTVMPCVNGYCAKIWHAGDKCHAFSDGACEAGTTCADPGADGWGTCKGAPKAGSPCENGACAADAWCDSGTCKAKKGAGEACTNASECMAPADQCTGGVCAVNAASACTLGH